MRAISLAATLALAACQQSGVAPEKAATPAPAASASAAPSLSPSTSPAAGSVSSLAGAWRVAGIDGRDFNEPYGLALSGNDRELWWEPRCAGVARHYRIHGTAIRFTAPPGAALAGKSVEVCAIGLPSRLADVVRALDAATSVTHTHQNGVLIAGGGRSVLLFSQ